MNINELTIGQAKELANLFADKKEANSVLPAQINCFIGQKVIIRTYSAGVFFGELVEKCNKEVILKNARRLYYWKTVDKGISLSEVAISGLHGDSKICEAVDNIWLEAIEIIPCTKTAIKSIENQRDYKA